MLRKISRLFIIKTRLEAFLIVYALALGAASRGAAYLQLYPGWGGYLLFAACTGAVFMAGAKVFDCLKYEKAEREGRIIRVGDVRGLKAQPLDAEQESKAK